jgi:hypothetical protein
MKSMIKVAALAGTIGPLLFGSVVLALTLLEYDFMRSLGWEPLGFSNTDWPSGLALGQYGCVMSFAFLLNGLLVVVFSLGLWQVLPPENSARVATALLVLAGITMTGLAFTTDPTIRTTPSTWHGRVHDACFAALGSTLFPSMLLLGWVFRKCPSWRGLSTYTWITVALAIPTFAFKGAAFYLFLAAVLVWTMIVASQLKTMPVFGSEKSAT